MANIQKTEYINQVALNKLLGLKLITYENQLINDEKIKQLKTYAKKVISGGASVKYHKANYGFGRRFADKGLQGLKKQFRHTLTHDIYYDVDIVNCHPILLSQLCEKHNIPTPFLNKYINNRETFLNEIMESTKCSRDEAKTFITIILYLGTPKTWKESEDCENKDFDLTQIPTFINDFSNEINVIANTLEKTDPLKIIPALKKSRDPDIKKNFTSSFVSITLGEIEDQILMNIIQSFENKGYNADVLVFDGCMVRKTKDLPDYVLREIEQEIKEKNGYSINLIIKPQDCLIDLNNSTPITTLENENDASQEFIKLHGKDKFVYCNSILFIFDTETGLWSEDNTIILKYALKYKDFLGKYATNKTFFNKMIEYLPVYCRNDTWIKDTTKSSLGKILFNNGWFDMKEGKFYDKNEYAFNAKIVFYEKINRNFKIDDSLLETIEEIKEKLFYNVFENEKSADWFIHLLARGLAGDIDIKKFLFGIGVSNAGKGVITTALREALDGYFGEYNAENLLYNKRSGNDEAQKNRWALLLRHKRLIISNEVRTTDYFDGNAIKKLSSGGDSLVGRLHQKNELEFIPHFLPIIFCNDAPKIKPYDDAVANRVRCITFPFTFTENITDDKTQKLADMDIKNKLSCNEWKDALVLLLIQYYTNYIDNKTLYPEPEEIQKAKSIWFEKGSFEDVLTQEFEITNNEEDYVTCKEIIDYCKTKNLGMSDTKIGIELNKLLKNFQGSKVKKINGKPINVRVGIRKYEYIPDEEVNELKGKECKIVDDVLNEY